MLDEAEYRPVHRLLLVGLRAKSDDVAGDEFELARAEFERTAGESSDGTSFTHHRLSCFGPPCRSCERPLGTNRAAYCVECGAPQRELQQKAGA